MALTDLDRRLVQRCLERDPQAWRDFVERYLGVIYHVINHTAHMRSISLSAQDVQDIAADILIKIVSDDLRILRRFRGQASLATYLAVIARRLAVHRLAVRQSALRLEARAVTVDRVVPPDLRIDSEDEVQRLLDSLNGREAELVRSYYLENKTYAEISQDMGIPENSIGPMLSRLRARLRKTSRS